jgi:hypothetical protein
MKSFDIVAIRSAVQTAETPGTAHYVGNLIELYAIHRIKEAGARTVLGAFELVASSSVAPQLDHSATRRLRAIRESWFHLGKLDFGGRQSWLFGP